MGFVISSIRLFYLQQLRNDLEHKIMLISEAKLDMARSITDMIGIGTDLDSDSPIIKSMKARREKLKVMEDELDQQMQVYKNKLTAVDNEIKSVQDFVKKGIDNTFNYSGGR